MTTPICDFIQRYAEENPLRLHMPGHKGSRLLGPEPWDLTEVDGADSLYEAEGIIRESEENASRLFGVRTFYSTEGSSQCIRAMVYLALLHARENGRSSRVLAGRNAHKTFLSAAALTGADVRWLWGDGLSYLSCPLTAAEVEAALAEEPRPPAAVYLTSPDYLGSSVDIAAIAEVCHARGVPLLVDNAHGAYLRFLQPSRHPADLGADLCCDSAHKTLPGLTGTAYLHVAGEELFLQQAKNALALFGSTSPSYLLLASLDAVNRYLAEGYPEKLAETVQLADAMKARLTDGGWSLTGDEPLKLTIRTKPCGYTGQQLSALLAANGIVSEFADGDHLVLMLTPEIGEAGVARLEDALLSVEKKTPIFGAVPSMARPERVVSVREALLAPCESVAARESIGRVLAAASVGCPPAVPIVVSGERICRDAVEAFAYYGISTVTVMKE